MNEKERLEWLINNPKKPNVSEWVYEVEAFLNDAKIDNKEARSLISLIKSHGAAFNHCDNLVALLHQIYKKRYLKINVPQIVVEQKIFVAMKFTDEMQLTYDRVYKPIIQSLNYSAMKIDEKQFIGSIIEEIKKEICGSIALIADLTDNCGGVYYEAGIAKGLQMCNHPIKLILTCRRHFFETVKVHFDVSGDNILLYDSENDLTEKLKIRLSAVLKGDKIDEHT